jgi:hypothetical protein
MAFLQNCAPPDQYALIYKTMKLAPCKVSGPSLLFLAALIFPLRPSAEAQNAPFNLRCSDKINPVGTDDAPWFGWYMNDPDDNEIQTAYRVLVASSVDRLNGSEADMWNSGKVNSGMQN